MTSTISTRQSLTASMALKTPVQAATTANIVLSGEQTIDGIAVKAIGMLGYPDRVLVKNQTNAIDNGIWDVSTAAWTRSIDANGNNDLVTGTGVIVSQGTQALQMYYVSTANPILVGTTAISWLPNRLTQMTDEGPFIASIDFVAGTSTTLLLSQNYSFKSNVNVWFDGTYQGFDQYSISGTSLIFTQPIPVGVSKVYVVGNTVLANGVPPNGSVGQLQLSWGNSLAISVDSIAALGALSVATYTRANVTGYYVKSDGGGGKYAYDATIAQASANGGTIIAAAGGTGCWILQVIGQISVRQFGAKGNGAADDTAAMLAADTACAALGLQLLIMPGNYVITGTFTFASEVIVQPGAILVPSSTLDFSNGLNAGLHQCLNTTSAVTIDKTNFLVPQWWGAKGDSSHDDTTAVQAWITAVIESGITGRLPAGTYVISSAINFLLNPAKFVGCTFIGDGVSLSILQGITVATSPVFLVNCTDAPKDNDYFVARGIGFQGNTNGIVFQMGNEDFSDPVNEPELDILVQNFNASGTARAVELNSVLNGDLRIIADTAGTGIGLTCNQVTFCTIQGSFGGPLGTGIHLTNGFNYGNVFSSCDIENVVNCVIIDNAQSVANTFIGGTWSYTSSGVFASAGSRNMIINPNTNPVSPGTVEGFVGDGIGITIKAPGLLTVTTPAIATGTNFANNTGQTVDVHIWGGTVTNVSVNGDVYGGISGNVSFTLNAGDVISLNYSSAPTWKWTPVC